MSQDVLIGLVKEVAADLSAQQRIEALSDSELSRLGLDDDEIASVRDGIFDQVLRLGIRLDDSPPDPAGCCG